MLAAAALGCTLDRGLELRRSLNGAPPHWVYADQPGSAADGAVQTATWADYPACAGVQQSPIDVRTDDTAPWAALDLALEPHLKAHVPLL